MSPPTIGHCLATGDGLQIACGGCDHTEIWNSGRLEGFGRGMPLLTLAALGRAYVCPKGHQGASVEAVR